QLRAHSLGFDHLSATTPTIPEKDRDEYKAWVAAGLAGGMAYMERDPDRRVDLTTTYPGIKTVLTLGVSYYQGTLPPKPGQEYGRVARYAWGLDYHDVISERLQRFLASLHDMLGEDTGSVITIDSKPILERALAQSSGLGFIGKNTVLIIPRRTHSYHVGSWVFLTEILLTIPMDEEISPFPIVNGCGQCSLCLTHCPTQAFERPYRLQSDRCISYLTIENKGFIPREMRSKLDDWIFGCDVCQDVCPYNTKAFETRWPEFQANRGTGPWISLREIFEVGDQATFKKKWGLTPLNRAKRKGLLRNACVVAGNSEEDNLVPYLINLLDDPEPMVRGHALWGLSKLTSPKVGKKMAEGMLRREEDALVREECEGVLGGPAHIKCNS
ncbi:tRNA epoxyqueuosine(34) reductase QueG, partial [bacterium F11]